MEYCHTLKKFDDSISNMDSTITEVELVMQILCQLPPSYHCIVDFITNTKLLPSFLEAKNMLLLHEEHKENVGYMFDSSNSIITSVDSG